MTVQRNFWVLGGDAGFVSGRTYSLACQAPGKSTELPAVGSKKTATWGIPDQMSFRLIHLVNPG